MKGTVILGAGPTGLGAAYRLRERGEEDFEIFERSDRVGGLATSFRDPKGYTWDVSGHIIFSGYPYFNAFLEKVLGKDGMRRIDRESWIKFEDRYVRYPFQNHLSSLPEEAMLECLVGLIESQTIDRDRAFRNFEEWVLAKFGAGVSKHFMVPYNLKVWSTPLNRMGFYWIAERVSVVDWKKALDSTLRPKVTDWGPNATFGYPATQGTLGLWLAPLPFIGEEKVHYRKRAVCVDEEKREIEFADGSKARYERLLTTLPLDAFVPRLKHAPEHVRQAREDAPLQPALLRRRRPETPLAFDEELDLLPQSEDPVLPDDLSLQLLARRRAGRRHLPVLLDPDGDDVLGFPTASRRETS